MTTKKETILDVDGMTCSSCIHRVQVALGDLEGVDEIEVKRKEGKVRIAHDSELATADQLIKALGEAGYASRAARA